jgi:hypothetical protein
MSIRIIAASILALGLVSGAALAAKRDHDRDQLSQAQNHQSSTNCPAGQLRNLATDQCVPYER